MELRDAVRRRRMVRSFSPEPVDDELLGRLLDDAGRAPSAGNTGGTAWLVLRGPGETAQYWAHTTTAPWRERSTRWPGLSRAPVVALSLTSPEAYVERYGEPDKAGSGLGPVGSGPGEGGEAGWPVPYWFGDSAFATMLLLLGATDAGLGAAFLGNFRGEPELLGALGVPPEWRLFGAVLLGHPDGGDHPSPSTGRDRHATSVHDGRWRPAS
ncbi:MAG TPA: nitroreductase family protein [Acidimicrobiales bacterium]|nr:nitroreductase family protein [Acidimicrobiales bacterium]